MVHMVPLLVFMDDVSGNISKQWNKCHAIYMSNASLPCEMLEKEFFVRFVTSSPHATPMELMRAMKESIWYIGIIAWDCKYNKEVLLIPYALFLNEDNPMQADECSHTGLNCNYFCRTCDISGTKEYKASGDGYNSLFMFETALKSGASEKIKNSVSSTGVCDSASGSILSALVDLGKKLRKHVAGTQAMPEAEVTVVLEKEFIEHLQGDKLDGAINPLLGMEGLDIHMDTPTEILHTILLGIVKYFWGQTVFLLDKAKFMDIFQVRLESIDKDGLNAPCLNADYICHYKGSLIRKHFKSLAQVMPFLIYDLTPLTVLNAWTVIGELVVLIWHTNIVNTEPYLAKSSQTIQDFLNITAQCAPSIIISKPKFHFLVHLPVYIWHFGPAVIFSTEQYKSFNHVFCLSCVYSNHQALSRDSCRVFAHQDIVKHIVTGGYWYDNNALKWVCGGAQVLGYLDEHPDVKIFNCNTPIPGSGKAQTSLGAKGKLARSDTVAWKETHCWRILKTMQPSVVYYRGKSVVIQETCHLYTTIETEIETEIQLLANHKGEKRILFSFADTLHASVHLPCLKLTDNEVVTMAANIICVINLQHNCIDSQCTDTLLQPVRQERLETSHMKRIIQHKATPHYFINTYSIHNYNHIHLAIPKMLRESLLRVTNVAEVQEMAVQQMKQKKALKKSGDAPQLDDPMDYDAQIPLHHQKSRKQVLPY
ncbi:uncharacterized protein EDB93DRAFT_1239739 [Suillus bovinus]|uniref:uncharacterized protein n=1 Tax=Suillus bovinus TaxID=48563 RepID=UPI001B8839D3|nr:uncharacterized protein EDB93DRAFT_1239739 [Suillus bovinus]KAG2153502.1 hypothetical protein EDB93DRAFT_1239739 [Suillus bovinus]